MGIKTLFARLAEKVKSAFKKPNAWPFKKRYFHTDYGDPYVIQYFNKSDQLKKAILFGSNLFFGTSNFGSDSEVEVANLQGGTYAMLLCEFMGSHKSIIASKLRFQSSSNVNLQQCIPVVRFNATGLSYTTPLNLSIHKDQFQQQADIVETDIDITIAGNTHMELILQPNSILTISVYPKLNKKRKSIYL